ncbi:MAG: hypothetical protein GY750_13355 [Lentisphaerae bacterium]|nr:hypothetical protein [Lentisphaerota bacterium]
MLEYRKFVKDAMPLTITIPSTAAMRWFRKGRCLQLHQDARLQVHKLEAV